jgi:hypothetical protein
MARVRRSMGWQAQILLITFIIVAVLFAPTTLLLFVGMLPTLCAKLIDKTKERTKVLTVGFMNFAGCFPYWFQLAQQGHDLDTALRILGEPMTIVIMYCAAAVGYLIEWLVAGIVASIKVQLGKARLVEISRIHEEMVEKWGPEVSGDIPMDAYGFAIKDDDKDNE